MFDFIITVLVIGFLVSCFTPDNKKNKKSRKSTRRSTRRNAVTYKFVDRNGDLYIMTGKRIK